MKTMLVMKSSPPGLSLLFLIISTSFMFGLGSVVKKTYTHVLFHYTWEEARRNCNNSNSDLAIVQTDEDKGMINYSEFFSWTSLSKLNGSDNWVWSPGSIYTRFSWADGEPQPTDSCASILYNTQKLYGFPCENYFFFSCNTYTNQQIVKESKTWKEALEYCKQPNIQVSNVYDVSLWIDTETATRSQVPEPSNKCVAMTTQTKTMADRECTDHLPSVCMTDNVILIKEKKTWEEAMKHCRQLVLSTEDEIRYELVSVEAGKDEPFLRDKASQADTMQVWVGLRFLGGTWFWTDGVSMEYPDLPQCPLPGKNCGVISKTEAHLETADCGEKKNFLCYKL